MYKQALLKALSLANHFPLLLLVIKTLVDLRREHSSKTLLLTWLIFVSTLLSFAHFSPQGQVLSPGMATCETLVKLLVVLLPNSVVTLGVTILQSIRGFLVKLHPARLWRATLSSVSLAVVDIGVWVLSTVAHKLSDQEKKTLRRRILVNLLGEQEKTSVNEEAQCSIISWKPTESKPSIGSSLRQSAYTPSNSGVTISPVTNPQKVQYKAQQPYAQKSLVNPRVLESINLKRSDVIVSEQTPLKYKSSIPIQTFTANFSKRKESPRRDLTSSFDLSMSEYSNLLQEEEQKLRPPPSLPKATSPHKSNKRALSKVQIYMESPSDPSKLQKLYLHLHQGDEIQILTLQNTLIQLMVLLKIVEGANGYFTARVYSSLCGMCYRTFKFKGDYSAFKKYIQSP